jgi:hypothetical protein
MQAQQALLEQQWHLAMTYHDSLEAATSTALNLPPTAGSSSSSSGFTADGGVDRQHVDWQQHATANSQQQQQRLFRGLRVRMGIATGLVAKGNSIKNSTVYKAAQGMYAAKC